MKQQNKPRKFILASENKAQAGAVFRLMVDAIVGLVILMTILAALSYFESQKVAVGLQEFENIAYSAVNAPNGKVVESNGISFVKGTTFTSTGLESMTGHKAECFSFQSGATIVEATDDSVRILQNVQIKVYARCAADSLCESDCLFCCTISFGKPIVTE